MADISKIGAAAPNDKVISHCETLLEKAKSGELRDLAYVGTVLDGNYYSGVTTKDIIQTAGMVAIMQADITRLHVNNIFEGE